MEGPPVSPLTEFDVVESWYPARLSRSASPRFSSVAAASSAPGTSSKNHFAPWWNSYVAGGLPMELYCHTIAIRVNGISITHVVADDYRLTETLVLWVIAHESFNRAAA